MECWATPIGSCSGGKSREHYLSRSIIGRGRVFVSGLPAIGRAPKELPGESLVAKMLCRAHNQTLSPLDNAAGHFFRVMHAFKERGEKRAAGGRKRGGPDVYAIDGALVERWMLKTLVNLAYGGKMAPSEDWVPPQRWIECVFGLSPFPLRCGLYLLAGEGPIQRHELSEVSIRVLTRSPGNSAEIIGAQFRMGLMQFALSMTPLHEQHQGLFRVSVIKDKPSLVVRQLINIEWGQAKPADSLRDAGTA